jgi:hypothetical protein
MIAGIHEDEWDDRTIAEHARLIAAAPELLWACKAALNHWNYTGGRDVNREATYSALRGVIGKVEG